MTDQIYTRNDAFDFGKQQIINLLSNQNVTPDTYATYSEDIDAYINYLKVVHQLPDVELPSDEESETFDEVDEVLPVDKVSSTDKPADDGRIIGTFDDGRIIGTFQKNLAGGIVKHPAFERGIFFVGEGWVRDAEITDGDEVEVLGYNYEHDRATGIRLIEKQAPERDQHIQTFTFGIVDSLDDSEHVLHPLVITKSVNGETLDVPYRLTTDDIERFNVSQGDILDIAWYENSPQTCKAIWKHRIEYDTEPTIEQRKRSYSSEPDPSPTPQAVFTDNQFEGYTICLVGMDMYKDKFKKAVEERAGNFIHVDPQVSRTRREAEYKKSDIVMLGLQQISHESSNHAIAFAKQENIKYGSFNGHGVGPFVLEIINRLNLAQ